DLASRPRGRAGPPTNPARAPPGAHQAPVGAWAYADRMSAEPVPPEDPNDPLVILRDLPERERPEFLRQYHSAVDAAHDPAGYHPLRRCLPPGRRTATGPRQPGYYEELDAARRGAARTVSADTVPAWRDRWAAAHAEPQ